MLLLINPTYVNTFVNSLRKGQNWMWSRLSRLSENGARNVERNVDEEDNSDDEDEDAIEMDDLNGRNLRRRRRPSEEV